MKNRGFEIFDLIGAFGEELGAKSFSKGIFTVISTILSLDFH